MSHSLRLGFLIAVAIFLFCPALSTSQTQDKGTGQKIAGGNLTLDGGVPFYRAWLQQDVIWIITDEERAAFKLLKSDEERDHFIEAFWARRDPTPNTFENEFKDEHYRRIVYANEHFGSAIPGWRSDRGRMYIVYGPPDEIKSYLTGRAEEKTTEREVSSYPLEVWHYGHLEGVGQDVAIEFVDVCGCGDYRMRVTEDLRDALLYVPGRLIGARDGREEPGDPRPYIVVGNRPKTKYKDLEDKLNARVNWKTLPFEVSIDTVRATDATSLVPIMITLQKGDITFAEGISGRPGLNILGRVITLTGHVAEVFEDTLEVGGPRGPESSSNTATVILEKTLALRNAHYGIEIAVQEVNSDRGGIWIRAVTVGGR
ncbi:MAG TPA: GWxTD domain-containing protein [Candidatus Sulfotelmatobacter sp.]|jgi:GWxTD domain-containing protein|nr:GWxTD domain-containing protein [Candidatus Sulfotelmatobacter sp.]